MTASGRPGLFEPTQVEASALADAVRSGVQARFELALVELAEAGRQVRRLAIAALIATLLALVAAPVLVVAAGDALAGRLGLSATGWHALFGGALAALAIAVAWTQWRRFRQRFTGLADTLAEFHADTDFLRAWRSDAKDDHAA